MFSRERDSRWAIWVNGPIWVNGFMYSSSTSMLSIAIYSAPGSRMPSREGSPSPVAPQNEDGAGGGPDVESWDLLSCSRRLYDRLLYDRLRRRRFSPAMSFTLIRLLRVSNVHGRFHFRLLKIPFTQISFTEIVYSDFTIPFTQMPFTQVFGFPARQRDENANHKVICVRPYQQE